MIAAPSADYESNISRYKIQQYVNNYMHYVNFYISLCRLTNNDVL